MVAEPRAMLFQKMSKGGPMLRSPSGVNEE